MGMENAENVDVCAQQVVVLIEYSDELGGRGRQFWPCMQRQVVFVGNYEAACNPWVSSLRFTSEGGWQCLRWVMLIDRRRSC